VQKDKAAILDTVELFGICLTELDEFIVILSVGEQIKPVINDTLVVEVDELLLVSGVFLLAAATPHIELAELTILHLSTRV
jgi:hypothetical protein